MGNASAKRKSKALSQITVEMQESPAFKSLSASAIRVLLMAMFFNYHAATRRAGKAEFEFTGGTAEKRLGMSKGAFSRAAKELANKGFWEWERRGGLLGCNGVASTFRMSSRWKTWEPETIPSPAERTGTSRDKRTGKFRKV